MFLLALIPSGPSTLLLINLAEILSIVQESISRYLTVTVRRRLHFTRLNQSPDSSHFSYFLSQLIVSRVSLHRSCILSRIVSHRSGENSGSIEGD